MPDVNHDRVTEILQQALQVPAAERLQLVAAACVGDAELRRAVESLLSLYDGRTPRLSIPVRIKITPSELVFSQVSGRKRLRRFLGAFSYRFGWDSLPGSFDNRDFIGPSDYHSNNNWLWNRGVVINVIQLLPLR